MRKVTIICLTFILCLLSSNVCSRDDFVERDSSPESVLKDKLGNGELFQKNKNEDVKNINFNFKDVELFDVIYAIAKQKKVNIIFPTLEAEKKELKSKLTINIPDKLTIDEAWKMLYTVLDMAGYSMVPNADGYSVVKTDNNISTKSLRIFIGIPYAELPDTDERIIYLAYFSNIQVPSEQEGGSGGSNIVKQLLTQYLSKEVVSPRPRFQFISASNGVMIIDRASNIRAVMKILKELDKIGVKEEVEMFPLQHTSASVVADLFNKQILEKQQQRRYRLGMKRKSEVRYFEKGTKVVAEPRTNSLILLGNAEAIERIKDFLYRYLDVAIESGRSILHRRKLDYMDANRLREVLVNVVKSGGGDEQATGRAGQLGPERFFDNVIIETDTPRDQEGEKEEGKYKYYGTNSLVVAAKSDDWIRIEDLIGILDRPQPQVILEVLVVDLRLEDSKVLGGHTRNPALAPLMRLSREGQRVNAQAAHLHNVVTQDCNMCGNKSGTIASDLVQDIGDDPSNPTYTNNVLNSAIGSASEGGAGSSMFTLSDKDGKTWSVLKILSVYNNAKVLSHPYIVAKNNREAEVTVGTEKILVGDATGTAGGSTEIKRQKVDANLTIKITPRIVGDDIVNTAINITIDQFADETSGQTGTNPRVNRSVLTNANIKSGEILTIGGLIRVQNTNDQKKTPILGNIPVLGWFFKSRSDTRNKNNLTVFIRPTIVYPQAREEVSAYTNDYIRMAKGYSEVGGLFEGLKDPVTRWFFREQETTDEMIDDFFDQHQKKIDLEELMLSQAENPFDCQEQATLLAKNDVQGSMKKDLNFVSRHPDKLIISKKPDTKNSQDTILVVNNDTLRDMQEDILQKEAPVLQVADSSQVIQVSTPEVTDVIEVAAVSEEVTQNDVTQEVSQKAIEPVLRQSSAEFRRRAQDDRLKVLLENVGNPFTAVG